MNDAEVRAHLRNGVCPDHPDKKLFAVAELPSGIQTTQLLCLIDNERWTRVVDFPRQAVLAVCAYRTNRQSTLEQIAKMFEEILDGKSTGSIFVKVWLPDSPE